MATREKKLSLNRKQSTSTPITVTPTKSVTTSTSSSSAASKNPQTPDQIPVTKTKPSETATTNQKTVYRKTAAQKVLKKNLIGIKAKAKKLSQRKTKKILKHPEVKKPLLQNGMRRHRQIAARLPLGRFLGEPKDIKRLKEDDNDVEEAIHSIISEIDLPKKKKSVKKPKCDESIEDVMGDLVALMKDDEKMSTDDTFEKTGKNLNKVSILKDLKKENIDSKVIDTLDLNVTQKKSTAILTNRRHSMEEVPVGSAKSNNSPNIALFTNLPRSISPRSKRMSKLRQSAEKQRSSPYSTRSDSPARILRNGKHRKLKDLTLLDGLDIEHRKRRRLCSDYSGSEVSVSKSGYESDSSFSDLASLPGGVDSAEIEIKKESISETISETPCSDISDKNDVLKTLEDNEQKLEQNVDTNSNVCESDRIDVEFEANPSLKVPDKSKILGIMKQTFNDIADEKKSDINPVCTGKFYGSKEDEKSLPELQPVEDVTQTETNHNGLESNAIEEEINEEPPILEPMDVIENSQLEESKDSDIEKEMETLTLNLSEPLIENEPSEIPTEEIEEKTILEEIKPENDEEKDLSEEKDLNEEKEEKEEKEIEKHIDIVETPESMVIKEKILKALGLQSLKAAEEAKQKGLKEKESPKAEIYTGTLKTVIKLNRNDRKRGKKMSLQKNRKPNKENKEEKDKRDDEMKNEDKQSTSTRERESSWKIHGNQSSESAGALRKSHYANRSNMDGSSEHTSDGDTAIGEDGKSLVIPEKASSFSIHPGRLCKDECSYCYGKFGLFDTPCHIAQMKSVERQDKVLAAEKHLTRDSCLCDACYRHVDRKSNIPSYNSNKSFKRNVLVAPAPKENHCHVLGCKNESTNILRRKWIIKMRKNICKVINIDLDNPGLHSIPICDEHYMALEHLMTCAMCKRKLAKNHIHYLGQELNDLNEKLNSMNIPVKLEDKPVVCKLCKYYATLVLSNEEDSSTESFFKEYTRRLLHFHDVEHMNEGEVEEPMLIPVKDTKVESERVTCASKKKKKGSKSPTPMVVETTSQTTTTTTTTTTASSSTTNDSQTDTEQLSDQNNVPSSESRAESPSDFMVDYQTLIPNIAMECGSDMEQKKEQAKKSLILKKTNQKIEIPKDEKVVKGADIAVQRLGSNPSISVRQLFPGEEDLPLQGTIEFNNVKERTPEGWEKCTTTIQFDADTKHLWQELQKPYGNQSSFLRHLILLEKYFRNGDLVLSPNASHHSINYSESVQNRLRAYDNTPTSSGNIQPLSMIPFNKAPKTNNKDQLNVINAANLPKNTPLTLNQLNNSGLLVNTTVKSTLPPGLMPLQPGTSKPIAPLVKLPQPQKIKFPITKNWRPNLIPIDPSKKIEKKPGLVQVISGGKPYHITLEDYKKMCAIKRTFDLKQKKLQDVQKSLKPSVHSILKSLAPKKISVSKTSILNPLNPLPNTKSSELYEMEKEESSLEKLDKQVEKLEMKLNEQKPVVMILPKIPKSLTVIPQTVPRKPSRPTSPTLQILAKSKTIQKS